MNTQKFIMILLVFLLHGCVSDERYDELREQVRKQNHENNSLRNELRESKTAFENMEIAISRSYAEKITVLFYCEWAREIHIKKFLGPICSANDQTFINGLSLYSTIKEEAERNDEYQRLVKYYSVGYLPRLLFQMQFLTAAAIGVLFFIPLMLLWLACKTGQYKILKMRCNRIKKHLDKCKKDLSKLHNLSAQESSLKALIAQYKTHSENARTQLYELDDEIDELKSELENYRVEIKLLQHQKSVLIEQCEILGIKVETGDGNIF